jgi:hypothetical protein
VSRRQGLFAALRWQSYGNSENSSESSAIAPICALHTNTAHDHLCSAARSENCDEHLPLGAGRRPDPSRVATRVPVGLDSPSWGMTWPSARDAGCAMRGRLEHRRAHDRLVGQPIALPSVSQRRASPLPPIRGKASLRRCNVCHRQKFFPRALPHAVDSFSCFRARQYAASIVSRYDGKCWLLNLQLTIFTTQINKEMGSQRRRR